MLVLVEGGRDSSSPSHRGLKPLMEDAAAAALAASAAMVAFVAYGARHPGDIPLRGAQATAVFALAAGLVSLCAGLWYLAETRPDLRRAMVVVGAVTAAVLVAHLYIINDPGTYQNSSASGTIGTYFGDTNVGVASSVQGGNLTVVVSDVGGSAISHVAVVLGGVTLSQAGFLEAPSSSSPLQPTTAPPEYQTSVAGSWEVEAQNGSSLTVQYQLLNCYHTPTESDDNPVFGCIMDEVYYVPSAMGILAGQQCAPYASNCNLEHPPLAKVLMAGGMAVFGLDTFGWRIASVVTGTLSIPLLFGLVLVLSKDRRLAYYSMAAFALDTMFFVHSSIGVIDVPAIFFSLAAFVFYFRPWSFWKFDGFVVAGAFLGLAALCKETAVFALGAVVAYELVFGEGTAKQSLVRIGKVAGVAALVFAGGLQLYDSLFTAAAQPWFYQQVEFIFSYGSSLTAKVLQCQPVTGYWCKFPDSPGGPPILPSDWLLFYTPVAYFVVTASATIGGMAATYVVVGYYGTTNPIVAWMVFMWVPLVVYVLWKKPRGLPMLPEEVFASFVLVWFLVGYLPYFVLFLYGRVTYPFYILPVVPALASGAAYFVTRDWFPKKLAWLYLAAALAVFFLYFPVKDFLPVYARVLLGR